MTTPTELRRAVDELESSINSTLVNPTTIAHAFSSTHPYLLNQLVLGLLKVRANPVRQGDGRIHPDIQKLAKELWP